MIKKVNHSSQKEKQSNFDLKSAALLFDQAQTMGLQPRWETDYGLFSVILPKQNSAQNINKPPTREFFFQTNLNLNGSRARILAKNKQFTRLVLAQANLPNIPYLLPGSQEQLLTFFNQYQPLICKPLLGDRSLNVKLITTRQQLANCNLTMNFFEQFIKGIEYRCLVLQDKVIALQKKELIPTDQEPWKLFYTGLDKSRWQPALVSMSKQIAQLLHLELAGVDFIVDAQGKNWVLEVNSAPGITKIHHPDAGVSTNAAELIWAAVLASYST